MAHSVNFAIKFEKNAVQHISVCWHPPIGHCQWNWFQTMELLTLSGIFDRLDWRKWPAPIWCTCWIGMLTLSSIFRILASLLANFPKCLMPKSENKEKKSNTVNCGLWVAVNGSKERQTIAKGVQHRWQQRRRQHTRRSTTDDAVYFWIKSKHWTNFV